MVPQRSIPLIEEEEEEVTGDHEIRGLPETDKLMVVQERRDEDEGEARPGRISVRRWLMHGAVMFGREFCYAMETALVTPVLLQIGLPEQYYSLTWFLSPVLGLIFTPVIGSASDRCTLRWGRRRPFVLALCVGTLLGVAMFLNGSLIGLAIGDTPGSQPIGIVFTMVGVVVLDFCADASEGPIRAYLLDVADTEEQDLALTIHAFSAGLGGALGYMLGGLDWTGTFLGSVFKSQEQVLFIFAALIFSVSVVLHLFSIPEQPQDPTQATTAGGDEDSASQLSLRPNGYALPYIDRIVEEEDSPHDHDRACAEQDNDMDFFSVERERSKSDSVLAMPEATIKLDPDLHPDSHNFLPEANPFLSETLGELDGAFAPSDDGCRSVCSPLLPCSTVPPTGVIVELQPVIHSLTRPSDNHPDSLNKKCQPKTVNGVKQGASPTAYSPLANRSAPTKLGTRLLNTSNPPRPHPPTFYRQPSFTFSYYGRVGTQPLRNRRLNPGLHRPVTLSRSLNDLSTLRPPAQRRELQRSASSLSSETLASEGEGEGGTTVRLLWLSMLKMPRELWRLCVCHLLAWFSYLAMVVFYTDFMGQVIFQGDPTAPSNSTELQNYNRGVQMGCWGLVVYAATAALCSAILQKYLDRFDLSIKIIYVVGTLAFSVGTAVMAIFPNVYVSMVMISTMGVISMSISYCPYALLGQYHEIKEYINHSPEKSRRGFGIDCAILSCQVYVSQILAASALGAVVEAVGSVRVIPMVASGGAFLGFLAACFLVIYPEAVASSSEQSMVALQKETDHGAERNNQGTAKLKSIDSAEPSVVGAEYEPTV
ncbi:solute carrier family 45 member 4 [Gadus chalcogrammus]|uniref:solute carrier family 45 member 4 n=1 Tax=Gadus chalcogrammus TaxID=1042646 RepID=UPI0024C487A8|nr:solute carrier family 45 member 4 [Gadus chalcogrammus]